MSRGILLLLLSGTLIALGFVATRSVDPSADFVIANRGEIITMDPGQMSWMQDIRIAQTLWEGLCTFTPDDSVPTEGVAYFPPAISPDGRTYTFALRPEARWSNGDPVTAGDFTYAFRRAIEPGTAGEYAFLFLDYVAGAREYADWRSDVVGAITAMRTLARGGSIEADPARRLRPYLPPEVAATVFDGLPDPPGGDATSATRTQFERLWRQRHDLLTRQGRAQWSEQADRLLAEHVAQMDARYAETIGWRAVNDRTLEIRLTRPTPYYPELCAFATMLPVHRASVDRLRTITPEGLWVYDTQWPKPDYRANGYPGLITNGAYVLREWKFKRYLLLERNPYYWDAEHVAIPTIKVVAFEQPATGFLAFERGQVDWLTDPIALDFAPELVAQMRSGRRNDMHSSDAFGTYYYAFNCRPQLVDGSRNPFADARVRLAFDLALDKQAIVDSVVKLGNRVALTFVPPGSIAGYTSPHGLDRNPDRARTLLAEAGFPGGQGFPEVDFLYNSGGGHEKIAEAAAKMWRDELGVRVSSRVMEVKTFRDAARRGQFMIARKSWYGDYGDPLTFLELLQTGNGNNDGEFSNARYDAKLVEAAATIDPQRRFDLLAEAEAIGIEQEMAIIPMFHYVNLYGYRPNVRGLYTNTRMINPFKYIGLAGS